MRRMMLALSLLSMFVLVLVLPAMAQEPPQPNPGPPPVQIVARFLQLTQDQIQQFETLLHQREETIRAISEQIRARGQQLGTLLNSTNPDPAAVGALVLQIHGLNRQIQQAQEGFMSAFSNLLTQEQRDRLAAVQRASRLLPVIGAFGRLGLLPPPPDARTQQLTLPLGLPTESIQQEDK